MLGKRSSPICAGRNNLESLGIWMWSLSSSIRTTIRAFAAPRHRLSCSTALWKRCREELVRRSENRHESGAFLLGRENKTRRQVVRVVYYDELDPKTYSTGVCVLEGKSFGKLWKICRNELLTVVADIHTHGGSAFQSEADRTNPMIAQPGHIALIAPNLCKGAEPDDLCIYEYLGNYRWIDHSARAASFFYVGMWG